MKNISNADTISKEEAVKIREKMRSIKSKHACRRLEVMALFGEGKAPKEVSDIKGCHG